jgi:hypothetical protein
MAIFAVKDYPGLLLWLMFLNFFILSLRIYSEITFAYIRHSILPLSLQIRLNRRSKYWWLWLQFSFSFHYIENPHKGGFKVNYYLFTLFFPLTQIWPRNTINGQNNGTNNGQIMAALKDPNYFLKELCLSSHRLQLFTSALSAMRNMHRGCSH